jgi:hypothetical protein
MTEDGRSNLRTAAYWLRRALRARAGAKMYPEDATALENLAEMYEHLAERAAKLESRRPAARAGGV